MRRYWEFKTRTHRLVVTRKALEALKLVGLEEEIVKVQAYQLGGASAAQVLELRLERHGSLSRNALILTTCPLGQWKTVVGAPNENI